MSHLSLSTEINKQDLVFVDFETTGFSHTQDRIIEVGIVRTHRGKIVDQYSQLVNPEREIDKEITQVTGIEQKDLVDAPTFREIYLDILKKVQNATFIAHNVDFDYRFMEQEMLRNEVMYSAHRLCTVKLSRALFPNQARHNLDVISAKFGIEINNRHRALDDALATQQFFHIVMNKFNGYVLNMGLEKAYQQSKPKKVPAASQSQASLF